MVDHQTYQLLGRLEGTLEAVQRDVAEIKKEQRAMRVQIADNATAHVKHTGLREQALGFGKFMVTTALAGAVALFGSNWIGR